jgi:hypothetical protein
MPDGLSTVKGEPCGMADAAPAGRSDQMRAFDAYYTKTDRAADCLLAWFDELYRRAKAELADLSGPIALTVRYGKELSNAKKSFASSSILSRPTTESILSISIQSSCVFSGLSDLD